jgi:hypothetical protein
MEWDSICFFHCFWCNDCHFTLSDYWLSDTLIKSQQHLKQVFWWEHKLYTFKKCFEKLHTVYTIYIMFCNIENITITTANEKYK